MTYKSITTREFKAKCLKVLDDVAQSGESVTITRDGRPVARLVPIPPQRKLFGALKGSVVAQDGIVEALDGVWESGA